MKATTTLEQLCEIVSEKSKDNWDKFVQLEDIEFESLSRLQIAGQKFDVLKQAQCLISNRLRIPHSYLCRCPESLQYANLNHWLSKERIKRDTFFIRFDGNKVRAFFSRRYTAIDNLEILYKMLKSGFRDDIVYFAEVIAIPRSYDSPLYLYLNQPSGPSISRKTATSRQDHPAWLPFGNVVW